MSLHVHTSIFKIVYVYALFGVACDKIGLIAWCNCIMWLHSGALVGMLEFDWQIDGRNWRKSVIMVIKSVAVAYINLVVTARSLSIYVGHLEEACKYFAFSIISHQPDDARSWHNFRVRDKGAFTLCMMTSQRTVMTHRQLWYSAKWPPFRRRHFEMHFCEWNPLCFDKISLMFVNNPALV